MEPLAPVGWNQGAFTSAGGKALAVQSGWPSSGARRWRAFSRGGLEQGAAAVETEPPREEARGLEELAPRAGPGPGLPPHVRDAVQQGMQREGEQVRRGKPVGQALAATPEVALDVIAVARRTVEAFDLPAGASVRAMSAETSKLVKNVFVEARLPGRAMANSTQAPR